MEGPAVDRGVNFRAMEELFRVRDERMLSGNFECDMKLSILEVYNGIQIFAILSWDLFSP